VAKRALVIVESPAKVRTIQKYLDSSFVVKASMGHVRDLPKSGLGVDVAKGFKPKYVVVPEKRKVVEGLKKAAEKAGALYVATDPDREGEAIGWHLTQLLPANGRKVYRVLFNEITARAIRAGFQSPARLDLKKVDAQQARRILDRLVGYKLSPLLWKKVKRGLSAGRVQSVALRLIVDREREIQAFVPVEYWSLHARLRAASPPEFVATLREVRGDKASLGTEADVRAVTSALAGQAWVVRSVTRGERKRNPAPPFTTSTLQQEAWRKLRFSAKKTMLVAQQLYEGVEVGREGPIGLITYMRTDSVRVAPEAQEEARALIRGRFGPEYVPDAPPAYRSKAGAQEAHEAIRPADPAKDPRGLAGSLTRDQLALYRLVWERFLASQMRPAVYDTVAADIAAGDCLFRAQGSTLRFAGFTQVYVEGREETDAPAEEEAEGVLPPLAEGETLALLGLEPKQHFTQPPPRFTEASLVKLLEERGIGRPSTYAQIMSTIQEREYARKEKGTLFPTELGFHVTDFLVPLFPGIMDVEFTAQMEEDLDRIEEGATPWTTAIQRFYRRFEKELRQAAKHEPAATGEHCPQCGRPLVEKWGRYGKFLACSGYPECKFTQDLDGNGRGRPPEVVPGEVCEQCGQPMVLREGRYGRFLACQGYPECKTTRPLTIGIGCPEDGCGGQLVERRSRRGKAYYACSKYPLCKFVLWNRPVPSPCPACGAPFLVERYARGRRLRRQCVRRACDYALEAEVPVG
jgi:DNA topoisomerase-1